MECQKCSSKNIEEDEARAEMICQDCGEVCEVNDIQDTIEFHEMDNGKVVALGKTVFTHEAKQNTINKAQESVDSLCSKLSLKKNMAAYAMKIYKSVLRRGLTKGKKSSVMIGACIYLAARINHQSIMLLDVSDKINENVYTLGKVYNQIKDIFGQKVGDIDPCLFIDRFANDLELGEKREIVSLTALKILQRMKKDWISTGRRPSGITASALLIASRIHHFDRDYEDVARIAGISQVTAKKRLQEWSETATANLTLSEFKTIDYEEEFDPPSFYEHKEKKETQGLMITDEEFSKIQDEIHQIHERLNKSEQQSQMISELMNSVSNGMMDINTLIGEIDGNASEIEEEMIGRKNLIKACIDNGISEEIFKDGISKCEKDIDNVSELETEELPIILDISNNEWDNKNKSELDMIEFDDDELISQYILGREESVKKLQWWCRENKAYYRNRKQAQLRKLEKKQKMEKSGKRPKSKQPRQMSLLEEALAEAHQLIHDTKPDLAGCENFEPTIKRPRLLSGNSDFVDPKNRRKNDSENNDEESNSLFKFEAKDSVHSDDHQDDESASFVEPEYDYEEFS